MLRWWDGHRWTEHRHPVVPPAPAGPAQPGWGSGPAQPGWGGPPGQAPYGSQPGWGTPAGWGGSGPGQYPPAYGRRYRAAGLGSNHFSWMAIGFAAAYLALALATGFVLLGIVPAVSAGRAWQRREKLAPAAVVAAVLAVGSAIYILVHRSH